MKTKFASKKFSRLFLACGLVLTCQLAAVTAQEPRQEKKKGKNFLTLDWFESADGASIGSPGARFKFGGDFPAIEKPWEVYGTGRLEGALLLDAEENPEPLLAELGFRVISRPFFGKSDPIGPLPPEDIEREKPGREAHSGLTIYLAGEGRFESDQEFDNANLALSAKAGLGNSNRSNLLALVPTVYIAFDGVAPLEATGADGQDLPTDGYLRFRAMADIQFDGEIFSPEVPDWLARTYLHAAAQYSYSEFPDELDEGLPAESAGFFVELVHEPDSAITNTKGAPAEIYARYTIGRIAPIPEDEQYFTVGARWKF